MIKKIKANKLEAFFAAAFGTLSVMAFLDGNVALGTVDALIAAMNGRWVLRDTPDHNYEVSFSVTKKEAE
jgi:hypothetical protein